MFSLLLFFSWGWWTFLYSENIFGIHEGLSKKIQSVDCLLGFEEQNKIVWDVLEVNLGLPVWLRELTPFVQREHSSLQLVVLLLYSVANALRDPILSCGLNELPPSAGACSAIFGRGPSGWPCCQKPVGLRLCHHFKSARRGECVGRLLISWVVLLCVYWVAHPPALRCFFLWILLLLIKPLCILCAGFFFIMAAVFLFSGNVFNCECSMQSLYKPPWEEGFHSWNVGYFSKTNTLSSVRLNSASVFSL